mmetsp:Transcript_118298/g.381856  ORF Transcript_118298/g.381856 Transcript_118298/m.381856 type:complete len:226 (-) Transcript_118298:202-879(-)
MNRRAGRAGRTRCRRRARSRTASGPWSLAPSGSLGRPSGRSSSMHTTSSCAVAPWSASSPHGRPQTATRSSSRRPGTPTACSPSGSGRGARSASAPAAGTCGRPGCRSRRSSTPADRVTGSGPGGPSGLGPDPPPASGEVLHSCLRACHRAMLALREEQPHSHLKRAMDAGPGCSWRWPIWATQPPVFSSARLLRGESYIGKKARALARANSMLSARPLRGNVSC